MVTETTTEKLDTTRQKVFQQMLIEDWLAHHEAGHAVVAVHLHVAIDYARIGKRGGYVQPTRNKGIAYWERHWKDEVVVCFAGAAAEHLMLPNTEEWQLPDGLQTPSNEDRVRAVFTADWHGISQNQMNTFLANAKKKAEEIIAIPYVKRAIRSVAQVLVLERSITAADIRREYREAKQLENWLHQPTGHK